MWLTFLLFAFHLSGFASAQQKAAKCQDLSLTKVPSAAGNGFFDLDSLFVAEVSTDIHGSYEVLVLRKKNQCDFLDRILTKSNLAVFNKLKIISGKISIPIKASTLVDAVLGVFQIGELKSLVSYKVEGSWPQKGGFTVLFFITNPYTSVKEESPMDFGCIDIDVSGVMSFASKARCLDVFLSSQKEMIGRYFSTD